MAPFATLACQGCLLPHPQPLPPHSSCCLLVLGLLPLPVLWIELQPPVKEVGHGLRGARQPFPVSHPGAQCMVPGFGAYLLLPCPQCGRESDVSEAGGHCSPIVQQGAWHLETREGGGNCCPVHTACMGPSSTLAGNRCLSFIRRRESCSWRVLAGGRHSAGTRRKGGGEIRVIDASPLCPGLSGPCEGGRPA